MLRFEQKLLRFVVVLEVCDDDRCCVFFMIGGKLMRLSLMLVKSLVFDFRRERERLFLVFPFFAPFLQSVCTFFAKKIYCAVKGSVNSRFVFGTFYDYLGT